ncbi:MAG: type II CAAX prenyl endopeptidase Rce1 family protein [Candidatus Woesearchaeota archaeon]
MIVTIFLSYYFFNKNRVFSKGIIITNLFVFFYFLYPFIGEFISLTTPQISTYVLILYTLLLAYLFLEFLGKKQEVLMTFKNSKVSILLILIPLSIITGFLFFIIGEPIPKESLLFGDSLFSVLFLTFILALLIGISEQLLFSGFVYNTYKTMTSNIDAQIQTSILFVAFHMIRIQVLIESFVIYYLEFAYFYLILYFIALFIFMNICIKLYEGTKKIKGSLLYSIIFHTLTDFTLILLVLFL